jgi:hypothetical protein
MIYLRPSLKVFKTKKGYRFMKKYILKKSFIAAFLLSALFLQAQGAPQGVKIDFEFKRQIGIASNQFAVWIEDFEGRHIKTLFVTAFTAGKGWGKRKESLSLWVKAFGRENASKEAADAVSRATPASGNISLVWDLKDEDGKPAEAGSYKLCIEANIKWADTVLFTCSLDMGEQITVGKIEEKIFGSKYKKQNIIKNINIEVLQ